MWRYLVLNGLWFCILFLVHFFGSRRSRSFVLLSILVAAVCLAVRSHVDPFVWLFYLSFSLVTFWGAYQFKRWSTSRITSLDEEVRAISKHLDAENAVLSAKTAETESIASRADQITNLCSKMKEMSQSLNRLETFLIFGEALARDHRYDWMKLAVISPETKEPSEVYQVRHSDLKDMFDRSVFLKDPRRVTSELKDADRRALAAVGAAPRPASEPAAFVAVHREKGPVAYPIELQNQTFAALLVAGVEERDAPVFSILKGSFTAEMRRLELYQRVQRLAITDGLTSVSVRRHLMHRLAGELERSKRLSLKLSFLMVDIDNFKSFNDQYGHLVGDVVLREVADTIRKSIREIDLVGRYGGEEFGVFLTETDESGAYFVAERIRRAVAERSYRAYDEDLKLTVSIGCATYSHVLQDVDQIVESADAALYQAKRQGKNRVHLWRMGV